MDATKLAALIRPLLETYPRYHDKASRAAVQNALRASLRHPSLGATALKGTCLFVHKESQKSVVAPSSTFVLLEWCTLVQDEVSRNPGLVEGLPQWLTIFTAAAATLEMCLRPGVRKSLQHSALVVSRRGLRKVIRNVELRDKFMPHIIEQLTRGSSADQRNAPYIGIIAGVCKRIEGAQALVQLSSKTILSFYATQIIGSKIPVSPNIAGGLGDFFADFVSLEDVSQDLMVPLEKTILRSPEIVLIGTIPAFVASLPATFDLSGVLEKNLLKPLSTSLKSTNPIIRGGAKDALQKLLERCHDEAKLSTVAKSLLTSMQGTGKDTELRVDLARELQSLSHHSFPTVSAIIANGLAKTASKENNEVALHSEILALCEHLSVLLQTKKDELMEASSYDCILKGCADKKSTSRKSWLMGVGSTLRTLESPPSGSAARDFVLSATTGLQQAAEEVNNSPIPAVQNGTVAVAYVSMVLASSKVTNKSDAKTRQQALVMEPKPSLLLNPRVYSRVESAEDQRWMSAALFSVVADVEKSTDQVKAAWAQAMLFLLCSSSVDSEVRRETGMTLAETYLKEPETIGTSMVLGMWKWMQALLLSEKDSAAVLAKAELSRLNWVIRQISPPKRIWELRGLVFPTEAVETLHILMLTVCQPSLLPGADWIRNCLQVGLDPGSLVDRNASKVLSQILLRFESGASPELFDIQVAACDAAATAAFVAPNAILPLLVTQITKDLSPSKIKDFGPLEAAIANAPEGVIVVDVLSQKTNTQEDKNRKDYDVLKWEEEIKAQVAAKKGLQKKLTAEQQAKVDAQLAYEASVRQEVREVIIHLRRGAMIINALATGVPATSDDGNIWISPCLAALLGALDAGAALFINDELVRAYLASSSQLTSRLGTLRNSVGVATLRAVGNATLPEGLEAEPLGELVTRVLYRLRFAAEQRPFDSASLAYMLPLIFVVLDRGNIGQSSEEDADAQVLLALEFLSYHMAACSDITLPRVGVLSRLINSMRRYTQHYRVVRDALVDFTNAIAANIGVDERDLLLKSLTLPESSVRSAILQAIDNELDLSEMKFSEEVWVTCYDSDEENAEIALTIWSESDFAVDEDMVFKIPQYLASTDTPSRVASAKALAQAVKFKPRTFQRVLDLLKETYMKESQPLVPKRDKFGMVQKTDLTDRWESRSGIALAFKSLAPLFPDSALLPFMDFLVQHGPLSDRNARVRDEMVEAGTSAVAAKGKEALEQLMKLFESILEGPDKGTQESDWVNEAIIVLYGSLAQHLPPGDVRVQDVISKLITTLSTPSESVQFAVAGCMPPLIRLLDSDISSYVTQLLAQLFEAKKYAARRGAAYGLAGVVAGKGISALRQYRIMSALRGATENKKSTEHRQGALFGYELFSTILGRTFEPYIIEVLPQLLVSFGDPSAAVRDACLDTAKACFASLSSFGVRQVLPRLLEGLDETQWRSKKGACDLLGAMAYLDPQQLASSLPDIIPPLTAVLTDTHKEVRAAANNSLQRFGEVISNPEVKSLVPTLLKALSDPTKYTEDALDGLIKVSFIHYIDAPSLALVVRILERGLGDRSSTKRKAAQIIGSLAHLTERRDLITHLPVLVSGLRLAAVDPVPATRATSSKALGSLVEKLGEDALPDLIPSLMASLRTDTGAGDRLGSAQALSEVLAGLGTGRLEETLPTILQNVSSAKPTVREGFMTLFIFLPACFGNSFANYLSQIIPSILGGLADELEAIRDISLRAGRLLVKNFATKAIDLLLPELQRGLADDSYRIRLSSVELVGDLLFNLTGISSLTDAEEQGETATNAGQSLLEVLGEDRRNRVLSSLYICRCDTSGQVKAAALAVWKALVATPRTLRELVPTLTQMIITRLASSNREHKAIAASALGELIRKAGDGVFAALLPSLEEGLQTSTDPDNRQGICIALREVVSAAQPEALEDHEDKLISIVRIALVDSNADVREAAAESFDALQQQFGKEVVDQVLPYLLGLLREEDSADNALQALLTLLTENTRANVILPNLIPTLLTNPVTAFNAKALASLARVGGSSMTRRLPIVLNTLADNEIAAKSPELVQDLEGAFDAVLQSVDDGQGLNTAMSVMLAMIKHEDHRKRTVAAKHLANFFGATDADYSRYNQDLIRVLLISFDDRDTEVVKAAWSALSELQKQLRKEEMESLVGSTRQVLQQVGVAGSNLPGFSLPKGIQPVLQIFLQGLMNGTSEQRMQAAMGISDIIDRSGPESLKPFVTNITGPLIRVVGERSEGVKSAILFALNQLLEKIPTFLRPFLPQLQRTFTKSIADPTSDVLRNRATKALSTLITLTPRVDPLIAELVTGAKTPDEGVRNSMLGALQEVVSKVGGNMSETSRDSILALIDTPTEDKNDDMRVTNARLLGALIKVLPAASATPLIKSRVLVQPTSPASILTLNAVLAESATTLLSQYFSETQNVLTNALSSRSTFVQQNAVLATGKFLLSDGGIADADTVQSLLDALAELLAPGGDIDLRRLILVVLRTVSRKHPDEVYPHLEILALPIFASVRDPVIPVKLAAEACFLQLFDVVERESEVFDEYIKGAGAKLTEGQKRGMSDYFKRVAMRLGAAGREKKEAQGGAGGMGLEGEEEDEREVWSVGRVEIGDVFAQE